MRMTEYMYSAFVKAKAAKQYESIFFCLYSQLAYSEILHKQGYA